MPASVAAASNEDADQAAKAELTGGAGGIDAVIAGFFAAAGADPAVLLSPTVALVAGVGMAARCFDGRSVQPGTGCARPRGFVPEAKIPDAAMVATPRSIPMLAVLHAYGARSSMSTLVRSGVKLAKARGAKRRAALLAAIGEHGAKVLYTGDLMRSFLQKAGLTAGGLLSENDLGGAVPNDERATFQPLSTSLGIALPMSTGNGGLPSVDTAELLPDRVCAAEVIVAADSRGLVAALCFAPDPRSIELGPLQVAAPRDATPVRRTVARVTPGTIRCAPMPIAILRRETEGWYAAIGLQGAATVDPRPLVDGPSALAEQLKILAAQPGTRGLAASVQRRKTALVQSP